MLKDYIKKNPRLERLIVRIKRSFIKEEPFTNSAEYWENRYRRRGDSGPGSYNNLAKFKVEVVNDLIQDMDIKSIIDWGCGDGNLVRFYKIENYLGLDVSPTVVKKCKKKFIRDSSKNFLNVADYHNETAQMSLSFDVIFHLVEDEIFDLYMKNLFNSATQLVLIYSSNTDEGVSNSPHFKHRKFSEWVDKNRTDFELLKTIKNRYPYNGDSSSTSVSDFFLFKKS